MINPTTQSMNQQRDQVAAALADGPLSMRDLCIRLSCRRARLANLLRSDPRIEQRERGGAANGPNAAPSVWALR